MATNGCAHAICDFLRAIQWSATARRLTWAPLVRELASMGDVDSLRIVREVILSSTRRSRSADEELSLSLTYQHEMVHGADGLMPTACARKAMLREMQAASVVISKVAFSAAGVDDGLLARNSSLQIATYNFSLLNFTLQSASRFLRPSSVCGTYGLLVAAVLSHNLQRLRSVMMYMVGHSPTLTPQQILFGDAAVTSRDSALYGRVCGAIASDRHIRRLLRISTGRIALRFALFCADNEWGAEPAVAGGCEAP